MWTKVADVLETDLGDELVLMHAGLSEMFTLNSAGRVIWQALPGREAQLAQALTQVFEVDDETAAQDVRALLGELAARSLITHAP
ncbi:MULTISPECIES: PqqD family protein [Deinococcus]|nr:MULTISPECIES: PqqD family protein [Deinococcus]AWT34981.1 PqqD family protein [Deinococcus actinosclerus]